MPGPILAAAGISAGASLLGARSSSNAADDAAEAQAASAQLGIDEQRRQFDAIQSNLSPFVDAGSDALSQQLALLGIAPPVEQRTGVLGAIDQVTGRQQVGQTGAEAQQAAYDAIENGAGFQQLVQQGENAILQNASATGGLRGGNTQAALAQFRPAALQQAVDLQYQRLGGLAASGQNSAALTGQAGQQSAAGISNLLQQQGAASAGASLAGATAFNQGLAGVGQAAGVALSDPGIQSSLFGSSPTFGTPSFTGLY